MVDVQRSTSDGFSQLPVDQTFEPTLSRNVKTKVGIIEFSKRKRCSPKMDVDGSLTWSAYRQVQSDGIHGYRCCTRMQRNEADVRKVIEVVRNW